MIAEVLIKNNGTSNINSSGIIKTATILEEDSIVGVAMMGFSTDPAARWVYRDSHQYFTNIPRFIRAFAGKSFESGSAFYVEGFKGAALWLPPDVHPDEEALISLFEETAPDEIKKDLFELFEQMGAYHPDEPHWYLPMIGVDPTQQNKGCGSALMRHALAVCDRENKPAYLESSNPRNISLYSRFGFEIIGTIQVGSSPPIFPMLRRPR